MLSPIIKIVFCATADKVVNNNTSRIRNFFMQLYTSMLKVEHVSKSLPSGDSFIDILKDINLDIKHGESLAVQGKSGSGKTTLLTLLAGLDLPTSGNIYFQQQHLSALDEE